MATISNAYGATPFFILLIGIAFGMGSGLMVVDRTPLNYAEKWLFRGVTGFAMFMMVVFAGFAIAAFS